jgi:prepilin-type N-terminal cleavage/methylation domain-containing protein
MTGKRGFTLIEVIGALVIFSGGVLVAMSLSRALTTQMSHATVRSEAMTLGRETLDSINAFVSFSQVSSTTNNLVIAGRTYTREIEVDDVGPRMREVRVTILPPLADGPEFRGRTYLVQPW